MTIDHTTPLDQMLDGTHVIPVMAFSEVDATLDTIGNMIDAGLRVIELTLRSPVARETLRAAKDRFGDRAAIGMGTILTPAQLHDVVADGADFGVSPGTAPRLLDAICEGPLPFLPGVATVSEAMALQERGLDRLKFFPAEQSGGAAALKGMGAVLPDVRFCPTGGVIPANAPRYLALSNVMCVGSSGLSAPAAPGTYDRAAFARLIDEYQG